MKDSGIPWIGEIPSHWRVEQIGSCIKEVSCPNTDNTEDNALQFKMGTIISKKGGDSKYNPESLEAYNKVRQGDIIINGLNLSFDFISQRVGLVREDGVITSTYLALHPLPLIDSRYLTYLFKGYDYCKALHSMGRGLRATLGYKEFRKYSVIFPSLKEQQAIADYLDKKCGEIDEMVSLQEKIVEELKAYKQSVITEAVCKGLNPDVPMKDSGIEWIGQIPEGWRAKRLKFSCEVFGRIGFRGYTTDDIVADGEGAITLSPSNMKEMTMDFSKRTYLSWNKYNESPEIMVYEGDVLMVKTGSSYGKCSFVDSLPMESTINPQIVVFKKHKDNAKYIAYYFQTPMALAFIKTSVVGGTIPTIAQEKIMNYYFAFPPREEQNAIVDYLDIKCAEIDALISLKQSKIEALKEYKKSTIYEYITGKKELNG